MTLSSLTTKLSAIAVSGLILSSAAVAEALTINRTTGFWGNPVGGSQEVHGNEADGVTTFGADTVQSNEGVNQVRWGTPFVNGAAGDASDHAIKSGLGFEGIGSTEVGLDETFELGTLTHYNNPIALADAASSVSMDLAIDFGELGLKTFDFNFDIEETPNSGTCAYESVTSCADRISWTSAFSMETFVYEGQKYTVELLGFRDSLASPLVSEFISQEGGSSEVKLYGRLTADPVSAAGVPEPASLLGVGLVGSYLVARRRRR